MKKIVMIIMVLFIASMGYANWPRDVQDVKIYGGGLTSTDLEQYQVSQGNIYIVSKFVSLATGTSNVYMIDLASGTVTQDANMRIGITTDQDVQVHLFRNSTVGSSSGTAISPINLNDDYASTSPQALFYYEPVMTSSGTEICVAHMMGESGVARVGGLTGRRTFWHFIDGNDYLLVIWNHSGSTANYSIMIEFIMEDN